MDWTANLMSENLILHFSSKELHNGKWEEWGQRVGLGRGGDRTVRGGVRGME